MLLVWQEAYAIPKTSDGEIVEFHKEFDETMEVAIEATPVGTIGRRFN